MIQSVQVIKQFFSTILCGLRSGVDPIIARFVLLQIMFHVFRLSAFILKRKKSFFLSFKKKVRLCHSAPSTPVADPPNLPVPLLPLPPSLWEKPLRTAFSAGKTGKTTTFSALPLRNETSANLTDDSWRICQKKSHRSQTGCCWSAPDDIGTFSAFSARTFPRMRRDFWKERREKATLAVTWSKRVASDMNGG